MKNSLLIKKVLQEVLNTKAFERLNPFRNADAWSCLADQEKEQLASLFIMEGKSLLKEGKREGEASLRLAAEVAPRSPKIYYEQGLAYASQHNNLNDLAAACIAYGKAVELDASFFHAWRAWGAILMEMGAFYHDTSHFEEAEEKFQKASQVTGTCTEHELGAFYWEWGLCGAQHGKISGEAIDYRDAIEKFTKAVELGIDYKEFWNDYGNAIVDLGYLVGRQDMFLEAVEIYQKAVKNHDDFFQGWFNLASCLQHLFEISGDEAFFEDAQKCFEQASEINATHPILWFKWGMLFLFSGKNRKDLNLLAQGCNKFSKADELDPSNPLILNKLGDTLMTIGSLTENLDLLKRAEDKIAQSVEIEPENPHYWAVYGECLNELGHYFNDEVYYIQAIGKFQYALSLNRSNPIFWYGLAVSHFSLGELKQDKHVIEKAVRFYSRVIEFTDTPFPQFWNDWGVVLMKLAEMTSDKRYIESAIEKFEHAIEMYGENYTHEPLDLEFWYNYGCALDFLGDFNQDAACYEKAIQVLSKILQVHPAYTHARYNLALAYSHLGELVDDFEFFQRAVEHFEMLVNENPEDEMAWNDLGLTYVHWALLVDDVSTADSSSALYEKAGHAFMQAVALGHLPVYYNLSCLYSLIGNHAIALHYLQKAEEEDALPEIDDIMHDEWLEGLRHTAAFRNFISQLTTKFRLEENEK
ncbi:MULTISPECIES: tetratricopeptide repeat protein [Parachlamydia]|jgi:tetratricopeptide (TPR) repeat protein|uniref:Uncharacterized protein n=2 Tax=Parachlamydia acanthamoebae TaxID=83552 RepID=F8KWU7_PARAV|nr:tetratricopeptide repeat protein [Parachlamydia acanthamoebae]EFB42440.1 hypothetical protein pah_c008o053 [Parachlamydia acanthamoebae str. Hall's coccus]CCB86422.1 putative uncharacterized protein [Parachlamydia acanthamoebae UV-7]